MRPWREERAWWRDLAGVVFGRALCWAGVHHDERRYALLREAACIRCGERLP